MPAIPTHYRNLRVSETASDKEIREAYLRLSKRYHPDFNPDNPEALRIMKMVNKAYAVLSDPEQRKRHDAWIAAQRQAKATNPLLQQAAAQRGLALGEGVTDYVLTRFSRDMGSLMRLLERLDRYSLQTRRAVTIPLIKAMLEEGA